MNLYFIAKQEKDENFDWFACAGSKEQALTLWQAKNYVWEILGIDAEPDNIFLVPAIPQLDQILEGPHLLEWHTEVPAIKD